MFKYCKKGTIIVFDKTLPTNPEQDKSQNLKNKRITA